MSDLILSGKPVVSFEFEDLPSVNTHYNKHFRPRAIATAEWRYEAKDKAQEWLAWHDDLPYFKQRVMVIVKVYPPYEEISDIHNIHIKPLLDGFTEAELWKDDEWAFVPITMFVWGGITEHAPRERKIRRTVIDIHRLDKFWVNYVPQLLPKGRKWIERREDTHWGKL